MPGRLQRAIDAGLVEVAAGDVRFTHPLYRSVLYAGASRVRRHTVHRRLADLTDDLEERARHLALSAESTDETTAAALDEAAALARDRGAPDAAAELCEHAIRLTPPSAIRDARRRHLVAADHRFVAGDPAAAERHAREALRLSAPGAERADGLRRVAALELERGAAGDARRSLEAGASEAGVAIGVSAEIQRDLAELTLRSGGLPEAERYARSAAHLAERSGDPALALAAHTTLSRIRVLLGEGAQVLVASAEQETTGPRLATDALGLVLAEAEIVTGRHERARASLDALGTAAAERGDEPARRGVLTRLAELEMRDGAWERAASLARDAAELAALFGLHAGPETGILAYLAAMEGREDECRTAARLGMEAVRDDRQAVLWHLGALGELELSLGRADLAIRHLGRAGGIATEMGVGEPDWFPFLADEAEALVIVGELGAADRRIDWFRERGATLESRFGGRRRRAVPRACSSPSGDGCPDALASAASAVERYEALPLPFEQARSQLTLGTLRRRDRQKRDAREALQRALELFESLGARIWADRARAELARIGGRRASLNELTEAEARVVRLAASGLTNREIARTLSMSVRTVEGHLSHAYAKLGLRSRTELAVFFEHTD